MPDFYDPAVLTDDERAMGEFSSRCGVAETAFEVDRDGRVFVTSNDPGGEFIIVLNEGRDAGVVLRKIIACARSGFSR